MNLPQKKFKFGYTILINESKNTAKNEVMTVGAVPLCPPQQWVTRNNSETKMEKQEKFKNVIIAGIVGDMLGASHENTIPEIETVFHPFGKPEQEEVFYISDDSQFTLATCQVIAENQKINGELLSEQFKEWFKKGKFSGLGSSTLKALKDLEAGIHWSLAGHKSERAAGNGVAMRIAPIGLFTELMNK